MCSRLWFKGMLRKEISHTLIVVRQKIVANRDDQREGGLPPSRDWQSLSFFLLPDRVEHFLYRHCTTNGGTIIYEQGGSAPTGEQTLRVEEGLAARGLQRGR